MNVEYIIVQAGGKGTRLEHLTENKPKALVPVENLPMLFHLFRRFPDKRFIIIADYKKEVLREYLSCFANVKYQVVDAERTGTCGGIKQALDLIQHKPFMLIWSDLILPEDFEMPNKEGNYIGISEGFPCRWSFRDGEFIEERSEEFGVAGMFIYTDKSCLAHIPESGEFVKWLKERHILFAKIGLAGTREFGTIFEYQKLGEEKSRPFNKIIADGDMIVKEGIDEQGQKLQEREARWYQAAIEKGILHIPKIYTFKPIKMEKIEGKNIYEYDYFTYEEKKTVLKRLIDSLNSLHDLKKIPADSFSLKEAYYNKTINRLAKIRDLVPFANQETIIINGKECRNVFFHKRELEKRLESIKCDNFCFIHGDCTFSNMMLKNDIEPIFIDPRGYFGYTELYGDPNYDWAKLYYSLVGNYDRFNLKNFILRIDEEKIELEIATNKWEELEQDFFMLSGTDPDTIKLLHAIIWLSLTTYAWQDYDSICGAFYNGLYYLEEVL